MIRQYTVNLPLIHPVHSCRPPVIRSLFSRVALSSPPNGTSGMRDVRDERAGRAVTSFIVPVVSRPLPLSPHLHHSSPSSRRSRALRAGARRMSGEGEKRPTVRDTPRHRDTPPFAHSSRRLSSSSPSAHGTECNERDVRRRRVRRNRDDIEAEARIQRAKGTDLTGDQDPRSRNKKEKKIRK